MFHVYYESDWKEAWKLQRQLDHYHWTPIVDSLPILPEDIVDNIIRPLLEENLSLWIEMDGQSFFYDKHVCASSPICWVRIENIGNPYQLCPIAPYRYLYHKFIATGGVVAAIAHHVTREHCRRFLADYDEAREAFWIE